MAKAIVITDENKKTIESQYDLEVNSLDGFEGLTLIADFGAHKSVYGYVNEVAFDKNFEATGTLLENGYFEVRAK